MPLDDGAFQFDVGCDIEDKDLKAFLKKRPFKFSSAEEAVQAGKKFCGFARLLRLRCQQEFEKRIDWNKFTEELEARGALCFGCTHSLAR